MSLSTKLVTTTCIEDLPWEMISELFEYLQPKDLVVCSMVNRRWCSIYADFKVQRLVTTDYFTNYEISRWYDSRQQIRQAERCQTAIFRHLAEKPLLSNLKQLALCGFKAGFDLNEFNRFSRLVHLEINIGYLGQEKVHLNLPKLKVLAFDTINNHCPLSIDCPELSTLLYQQYRPGESNTLLDIKQPETIRKLVTNIFGPKLSQFKGLECLMTREYRAISKATLLSMPRLKEFRYIQDIERCPGCLYRREFRPASVDRMKRTLNEFLDEAKKLRGSDFQFRFSGFQLAKVDLDQIDLGLQVDELVWNEYVYLKNYHLIKPGDLHFVYRIDYIRLSSVTGELPRCLSQKFTGIDYVAARAEVQDADQFLWFLESLRSFKCLELEQTGLSQKFYDQLSVFAHSLSTLKIQGDSKNDLQLNFDFVGKFSRLSSLSIKQSPLSFGSLISLVRSVDKFAHCFFEFRLKGEGFKIWKGIGSTEWMISSPHQVQFVTENPEKIVNFFEVSESI